MSSFPCCFDPAALLLLWVGITGVFAALLEQGDCLSCQSIRCAGNDFVTFSLYLLQTMQAGLLILERCCTQAMLYLCL